MTGNEATEKMLKENKTAMTELIDEIDYAINKRDGEGGNAGFSAEVLKIIKQQATELLEKEKTMIVDAYCSGGLAERFQEAGLENDKGAEEYYKKRFT